MKKVSLVLGMVLMGWVTTTAIAIANSDDGVDALVDEYYKKHPEKDDGLYSKPVKKDPASGFWTCNGIKLHMGVDMKSWQDLTNGEMFTLGEAPSPVDPKDKDQKIKGTDYIFNWIKNPAVTKWFIVDKTGKGLYIRDDIDYYKSYKCKRDK